MTSSPALFHPRNLSEALDLLATTADARPLSGGASLVAMMNAGLVAPAALVSLTRIPELCGIRVSAAGDIAIGAATRHNEIAGDGRLSGTAAVLADAAAQIAGTAVRNMGTIGGAMAHADPALDFPSALVAVEATVEIASSAGRRLVPIGEFFVDWYTTVLAPSEIVAAVHIHKPKHGVGIYLKHARVAGDFAIVSVAVTLARDGEVHVAIGGCGPSRSLPPRRIGSCLPICHDPPRLAPAICWQRWRTRSTTFGSAKYRKVLIPRMLARALHDAVAASRSAA